MRALGQNPTESEVKKLVNEHRADDRVTFEVFLPIMQVSSQIRPGHLAERAFQSFQPYFINRYLLIDFKVSWIEFARQFVDVALLTRVMTLSRASGILTR